MDIMERPKLKDPNDFKEVEELVLDLEEYVKNDPTDDGISKRLDYIAEAAITALYGDEFYDWINSKFRV
jgi:hypothetical protein